MMTQLLSRFRRTPVAELAEQAAAAAAESVWELVRERLDGMSSNEARGYIRARGRISVQRAVRQFVTGSPERVLQAALELVSEQTLQRHRQLAPPRRARAA